MQASQASPEAPSPAPAERHPAEPGPGAWAAGRSWPQRTARADDGWPGAAPLKRAASAPAIATFLRPGARLAPIPEAEPEPHPRRREAHGAGAAARAQLSALAHLRGPPRPPSPPDIPPAAARPPAQRPLQAELGAAARRGDGVGVAQAFAHGAQIDAPMGDSCALREALRADSLPAVRQLLALGASLGSAGEGPLAAVGWAVEAGAVRSLPALVRGRKKARRAALRAMARCRHPAMVGLLVRDFGAGQGDLDEALWRAAAAGCEQAIRPLCLGGARGRLRQAAPWQAALGGARNARAAASREEHGEWFVGSALHIAAVGDHGGCLSALAAHCPGLDIDDWSGWVALPGGACQLTPLGCAAVSGSALATLALVDAGARHQAVHCDDRGLARVGAADLALSHLHVQLWALLAVAHALADAQAGAPGAPLRWPWAQPLAPSHDSETELGALARQYEALRQEIWADGHMSARRGAGAGAATINACPPSWP